MKISMVIGSSLGIENLFSTGDLGSKTYSGVLCNEPVQSYGDR